MKIGATVSVSRKQEYPAPTVSHPAMVPIMAIRHRRLVSAADRWLAMWRTKADATRTTIEATTKQAVEVVRAGHGRFNSLAFHNEWSGRVIDPGERQDTPARFERDQLEGFGANASVRVAV